MRDGRLLLAVMLVSIIGLAIYRSAEKNKEVANLKAEITALRSAMDSATVLAEKGDGMIVTYSGPVISKIDDSAVARGIVIEVQPHHHGFPTTAFIVGTAGNVNVATYGAGGQTISNHSEDWGTTSKWRR